LADCHRALGHWPEVAALWEELRAASPGAEVVTEGRIVAAGALADQGQVRAAIRLLRKGAEPSRPKWFHPRLWYALADLYERAGGQVARVVVPGAGPRRRPRGRRRGARHRAHQAALLQGERGDAESHRGGGRRGGADPPEEAHGRRARAGARSARFGRPVDRG